VPSKLVIAIDGPAGAGKSTIAKLLASKLGLSYLDTGAMYRALALKASRVGIDGPEAADLMTSTTIAFGAGDPQRVLLDGEDVTTAIRTAEIGEAASALSSHPPVRRAMVALQQAFVAEGGVVLEGRDTTTVVAPNAGLKLYLTASLEERAKRRSTERGDTEAFERTRSEIELRDHRDITRDDSPLSVAPGAHVIETATLSIDEVMEKVVALLPSS
jgi:cytidylate kinase